MLYRESCTTVAENLHHRSTSSIYTSDQAKNKLTNRELLEEMNCSKWYHNWWKLHTLRPLFPSFLCDNKLNTTERGAADVMFKRGTEIYLCDPFNPDLRCAPLCGVEFVFKKERREKRTQRRSGLKGLQRLLGVFRWTMTDLALSTHWVWVYSYNITFTVPWITPITMQS